VDVCLRVASARVVSPSRTKSFAERRRELLQKKLALEKTGAH
jgi:uncharacterized protein (DUF1786 family)